MTGFRPFVMSDVELLVAQRATLDATLQVGDSNQVVTVTTLAPIVDTTVSEVGQVVNTTTIDHVPAEWTKLLAVDEHGSRCHLHAGWSEPEFERSEPARERG